MQPSDNERQRERERVRILLAARRIVQADLLLKRAFGEPERQIAFWESLERSFNSDRRPAAILGHAFAASEAASLPAAEIKARPEYKAALQAWRRAMSSLYSREFADAMSRLREGDSDAVEAALLFVEADPWCFRSGYWKQDIMRYLRHVTLTDEQTGRVRAVLYASVKVGLRMEFREYCRTARVVDSAQFRRRLKALRDQGLHGPGVRQRAGWMLDAIVRANGP
jgi:hypothetical protein